MQAINARGTFLMSRTAIPHPRAAENPHILTLSPPLNLAAHWMGRHLGYTLSKYGMSRCALGLAAELTPDGIPANSPWPRTLIDTAAVRNVVGDADRARSPQIMADAAYAVLTRDARACTGNLFIDDEVTGRRRDRGPVRLRSRRPRRESGARHLRRSFLTLEMTWPNRLTGAREPWGRFPAVHLDHHPHQLSGGLDRPMDGDPEPRETPKSRRRAQAADGSLVEALRRLCQRV
ncbi:hypothetical protein [Streptomyces sp. NPDC020298]|uniref:hypothetical protein n=1 Tax=Streptomyces sp. NPDC020298 TaxID=3155010 RepID=UPI0033CA07E8